LELPERVADPVGFFGYGRGNALGKEVRTAS
jgi:hypothetical protein